MDNSIKPEKVHPQTKANIISRLFVLWLIPLLYKGARFGLTTDDLTKSLKRDDSQTLGDKLERAWEIETERARKKGGKARLRNALFRTFAASVIIDGLLILIFILLKCFLPVVLGQLLLQFQIPDSAAVILANGEMPLHNRSARALDDGPKPFGNEINSIEADHKINFTDNTPDDVIIANEEPSFLEYAWNDTHWLMTLVIVMVVVSVFCTHHADLRQRIVGARMRIACCAAIYRKTLRLTRKANAETTAGYVVNLMSNDVSRLDYGFLYIHHAWILPFQAALISYLIWQQVGVAAIVGVLGLIIKTVPVQTGLSRLTSKLRMKVAVRTDQRVGIMDEIIKGIQVIKMYAWEKPFSLVVSESRRREIKQIRHTSYIRAVYLSTMVFTERSTLFITLAACVATGVSITADKVFSMAQFFNALQLIAAIYYPLALSLGAEAMVSITRVEKFLLQEEQNRTLKGLNLHKSDSISEKEPAVEIESLTANWKDGSKRKTLEHIDFHVKRGNLCAIIGPVGAGKSSLFQVLLGELPVESGSVDLCGVLSYGSQEPWLFPGTVRNNILFGQAYDRKRYQLTVQHCALIRDFEELPNGDKTIVGERGSSLSGGQRARISLARAVYKEANIYLLDDPLSAVDAHVGRHLFDQVIGPHGYLAEQNATRILITHQVHFLKAADWIVVIEEGKISLQGTYRDLQNSNIDFTKLLERIEDETDELQDGNEEDRLVNEPDSDDDIPYIDGYKGYVPLRRKSEKASDSDSLRKSLSSTMDISKTDPVIEEEEQADGGVSFRVWKRYFTAGAGTFMLFMLIILLIVSQIIISASDYFVNYWTQQEFLRITHQATPDYTTEEYLYIYGGFVLVVIIMTILRSYLFFKICMTASKNLHNKMFYHILHAPMRFFDHNPSGRILNRFSRDMGSIDELLPKAMMDALQIFLIMFGILTMVVIVNPPLILPLVCAIVLYYLVIKLYLRPAQDLKRVEGICRSPIFSHLSATLNGLSTIRVNGVQNKVSMEFDGLQNVHSGVWHLTISANMACGIWLDIVSAAFVACVAFSFIFFNERTSSGNVGLAISQSLILTGMVQYGIRMATESIQQMISTERVLQYTDVSQESSPIQKPSPSWPVMGRIVFNDMSLRYNPNEAPVLKNLDVTIEPSWKVGIVGRTGAGKSSLISALFRLANIDGDIIIDDVNTGLISLESLRTKVSIIPQDPVLFSKSIRYNLDPFGLFDDTKLWTVLEAVELKNEIRHLDYMVTEGGSNFSVGQRQLICLARAILRDNKILVLDEATANVDPQTDALIQKTIREKFSHCTVLTIAHRLHTVMDSDRILVMEAGYAREFDYPHVLLQNENSLLRNMVDATGTQEAELLKKTATETHSKLTNPKKIL